MIAIKFLSVGVACVCFSCSAILLFSNVLGSESASRKSSMPTGTPIRYKLRQGCDSANFDTRSMQCAEKCSMENLDVRSMFVHKDKFRGGHSQHLRLRGGGEVESFDKSTQASIYSGQMPQDVSSEGDEEEIMDALAQGDYDTSRPDLGPELLLVKEVIRDAAIERGDLPNERYANLTAEEERQREMDEMLWFAASEGEAGMIESLVAQGANVSSVDAAAYNQTAMHCACQLNAGHADVVRALAEQGASVDARNAHDNTPLHEAAYWAHKEAVATLLELGADPFALNVAGHTPLLQAEGNFHGVSRPPPVQLPLDPEKPSWEDPDGVGWQQNLRTPLQRQAVVELLMEAMGNRSYGRGADPYVGGVYYPDMWEDWDEETEHYNPMRRKRSGVDSIPPPRNFLRHRRGPEKQDKESTSWVGMADVDLFLEERWNASKERAKDLGLYSSSSSEADSDELASGEEDDSVGDTRWEGKITAYDETGAPVIEDDGAEGGWVKSEESRESD